MNIENPHILIVDDDNRIRELLSRYLQENGYVVSVAEDASVARKHLASFAFDIIILDVMMPGENGFDLARALRAGTTGQKANTPFLMLTARIETQDRIEGLERGADDYLAKPFDPRELLLRLQAIVRRAQSVPETQIEAVKFGDFVFSLTTYELKKGNETVRLTEREREILKILTQKPGETVSRYDLAQLGEEVNDRTVDVQITRLRRKLGDDPNAPAFLLTVRGQGYRLIALP